MKSVLNYIEIGKSLGNMMLDKANKDDIARLMRWFKDNPDAAKTLKYICDKENIASRREFYLSVDTRSAWESVNRKIISRGDKVKTIGLSRVAIRWAAAAVIGVSVVTAAAVALYSDFRRTAAFNTIAQIHPVGSKAMLYRADGRTIELTAESAGLQIDGVSVNETSLEYDRSAAAPKTNMMDEVVTPRGGEYSLTLVDGTKVWLNSSSRLRYFTDPKADTRLVYAEGEVFFDVAHDAAHPFVVISGKQRIEVLGTQFNLNSYNARISTTLVEGSVALSTADEQRKVTLSPGQQSLFDMSGTNDIEVRPVDTDKYTAWRSGTFFFEQSSLAEIMESLSRWYDFQYEISPKLRSLRFTGQFPRYEDLSKIMSILLSTGSGIDVKVEGTTINII